MHRTPDSSVVVDSSATLAAADESATLADALTSGKVGVNVRARYEHVDQDNFLRKRMQLRLDCDSTIGQANGMDCPVSLSTIMYSTC